MIGPMNDEPGPGVLGSLPRTRPHRRSDKRAAPAPGGPAVQPSVQMAAEPTTTEPTTTETPEPARAHTPRPRPRPVKPPMAPATVPESPPGVLGTTVQAAAELAEIGLHAGARALRGALSRLPRP